MALKSMWTPDLMARSTAYLMAHQLRPDETAFDAYHRLYMPDTDRSLSYDALIGLYLAEAADTLMARMRSVGEMPLLSPHPHIGPYYAQATHGRITVQTMWLYEVFSDWHRVHLFARVDPPPPEPQED